MNRAVGAVGYWGARLITWVLAVGLWNFKVTGTENIPKSGPFLLCPNHRSNVDGPLTCILTWRRMRYLAKDSMFNIEILGKLYKNMGAISVNRGAPDRKSLQACLKVLEDEQRGLVLFPEGTRQTGDEIASIHEGAAYLAMRSGAPVVPVGFGGSADAHKKGKWYLSRARIKCVIGEPLQFGIPDGGRVSRPAVDEATEVLRNRLQELFDEAENRDRKRT